MGMAMFKRTFARTIPDNLRAPHMKMWGFRGKKGQKVHPNLPPSITMEFHDHAFWAPDLTCSGKKDVFKEMRVKFVVFQVSAFRFFHQQYFCQRVACKVG